jgi:Rrf2 family transcriptional regulator, iron-sulfur cluster assembly transcription factor
MLSKTSTLVINALIELAKLPADRREGAESLARKIRAPRNYLGKLLQSLATRGFLDSQRGLHGGFQLKKNPGNIKLYEIVEPIDNATLWSGCALGLKKCSDANPCAVHHRWKVIKEAYLDFLKNTTIADLIQSPRR